jgi:hypothetical protein
LIRHLGNLGKTTARSSGREFVERRPTMSYGPQNLGQLANSLAASADAVLATVQANIASIPDGAALAQAVARLAQGARVFRDQVLSNQPLAVVAQSFTQMDADAGQLDQYFSANPATPQVQAVWQAFVAVEGQTGQALQPGGPAPVAPAVNPYPPAGSGVSPVAGLADQLLGETSSFIAAFAPTAGRVPEGRFMLAEAQQLQAVASNFRQAADAGLAPDQLAPAFQNLFACWDQLGQRVNRVAQGRTGPNIAQVQKLGMICSQIGQALGLPG